MASQIKRPTISSDFRNLVFDGEPYERVDHPYESFQLVNSLGKGVNIEEPILCLGMNIDSTRIADRRPVIKTDWGYYYFLQNTNEFSFISKVYVVLMDDEYYDGYWFRGHYTPSKYCNIARYLLNFYYSQFKDSVTLLVGKSEEQLSKMMPSGVKFISSYGGNRWSIGDPWPEVVLHNSATFEKEMCAVICKNAKLRSDLEKYFDRKKILVA